MISTSTPTNPLALRTGKAIFSATLFCVVAALLMGFGTSAKADITTGLQLLLTLDQTNGLTVNDTSGNGNNGTLNGTPTFNDDIWVKGIINNALHFNGPTNLLPYTNEYIYVPDVPGLNFTTNLTYTISCWINCDGPAGVAVSGASQASGAGILDKGPGRIQQYTFDIASTKVRFYSDNSAGATTVINSSFAPTNGVWYLLTGVYSGVSTNKFQILYINGVSNASLATASVPTSLIATTNGVNVGCRQSGAGTAYNTSFKGLVDDVRIYNRALSASDVLQLFQTSLTPPIVTIQPKSVTRYTNDPVFFTVGSSTAGTITYQWQLNGTNISGATNQLYTNNSVQFSNAGAYTAILSNTSGSVTSAPAVLTISALPTPNLTSNLVAYYKFDDGSGTTATDSSPNGNTGQLLALAGNPPIWTNGIINDSLYFNLDAVGNPNVVCVPNFNTSDNGVFDFSTNLQFSLSCWVKSKTAPSGSSVGIIAKGFGGSENFCMDTKGVTGGFVYYRLFIRDLNTNVYELYVPVQANGLWQHLSGVYNATNNIFYYYVNGQLAGWTNAIPQSMISSTHELSIGGRQSGAASYNDLWAGNIDEVYIYNRDLTSAEVQALYNAAAVPPGITTQPASVSRYTNDSCLFTVTVTSTTLAPFTYQWKFNNVNILNATNSYLTVTGITSANAGNYSVAITNAYGFIVSSNAVLTVNPFPTSNFSNNLVAYWKFDETSGYTANDSSPNGNNAQLAGFSNDPAQWVAGIINGALFFDTNTSTADVVACPGSGVSDGGIFDFSIGLAFTLDCWVKGNGLQTNGSAVIAKGYGAGGEQFALDTFGNNYRFYVRDGNTNANAIQTGIPVDGSWQHLVATYNAANGIQNLYINGQLAGYYVNVFNGLGTIPRLAPTSLLSNQHEVSVGNRQTTSTSPYNDFWNGAIDDVRIYSRDLNSREVQTLFDSVATNAPVSLSDFSGGTSTTPFQLHGAGPANLDYRVWGTTNVALPFAQWTLISSGTFNTSGQFTVTDSASTNFPSRFYRVTVP